MPGAATGAWFGGQPTAFATFTVGISDVRGAGSVGFGPVPADTGNRAGVAHAAAWSAMNATAAIRRAMHVFGMVMHARQDWCRRTENCAGIGSPPGGPPSKFQS